MSTRAELLYRSFQGWTIIDRLDKIEVPTLVINGADDMAQDFVIEPLVKGIKGVKWIKYESSSHMPFYEERERYMADVRHFLED